MTQGHQGGFLQASHSSSQILLAHGAPYFCWSLPMQETECSHSIFLLRRQIFKNTLTMTFSSSPRLCEMPKMM